MYDAVKPVNVTLSFYSCTLCSLFRANKVAMPMWFGFMYGLIEFMLVRLLVQ